MSWSASDLLVIDGAAVRQNLSFDEAIEAVRDGMIALSLGRTHQLLRSIMGIGDRKVLGVMPGSLGEDEVFGAKLIGVFGDKDHHGRSTHQGLVVLFDGMSALPRCVVDAEAITEIRTAAASAVATDALARPEARKLTILGCGLQAKAHAIAISRVRSLSRIVFWGRSPANAQSLARELSHDPRLAGIDILSETSIDEAVAQADIVCTVTNAREPILSASQLAPGTHLNLVGSSGPGPVEVDHSVVVASRFIADFRPSILAQGSEFLEAKAAGLVGDDHVVGEIGEVLTGALAGRTAPDQLTIYKSIGHVVQDLVSARSVYRKLKTPPAR